MEKIIKRKNEEKSPTIYPLRDAIGRLFDESVWHPFRDIAPYEGGWNLDSTKLDIKENKNSVKVTADVPGIDPENINIEAEDDYLVISGTQEREEKEEEENIYREERSYGEFRREILLPASVDPDQIKAKMKDGVLKIDLPKTEKLKSKKVKIEKE